MIFFTAFVDWCNECLFADALEVAFLILHQLATSFFVQISIKIIPLYIICSVGLMVFKTSILLSPFIEIVSTLCGSPIKSTDTQDRQQDTS